MAVQRDAKGQFVATISAEDKASPAFNKISKNSQNVIKAFAAIGNANVRLNQTFELIGRAQAQLQRAIGATVGEFARFERAMVGVGKTANLSADELQMLGDEFQALSETIPATANELAALGQTAGQLGVTGSQDILKFSRVMAELATASDLAGESGATALARILNITDGGVQNIDRFAAAIVGLGNQFAATESEIARVATDVARSTSVFELGAANVAGISTAIKAVGIQAQLGGSVVGKAFRTIDDALRNGGSALETLQQITGQTGEQLRATFQEDSTAVFQSFIEGLGQIQANGGSVSQTLSMLKLEGDEVNKVLPVMAQRSDLVGKALAVANEEFERNQALAEEAAKANQTLSAEWQKLRNTLTNAAVDLSSTITPFLKEMIILLRNELREAIAQVRTTWNAFTSAIDRVDFASLAKEFETFGIAVAAAMAPIAAPATIAALASLTTFVTATLIPAGLLALKFAAIAAAVLSIAAAADIVARNFGKMDKVADLFAGAFLKAVNNVAIAFDKMIVKILMGFQTLLLNSKQVADFLGVTLGDAVTKIGGAIDKMMNRIEDLEGEDALIDSFIAGAAEDLDLGFAGAAFEEGKKFLEMFQNELDKFKQKNRPGGDEGGGDEGGGGVGGDTGPQVSPFELPKLFTDEDIKLLQATFGEATAGIASGANMLLQGPLAMANAANVILDAVQGLIDLIPQLLNKLAGVLNSFTELPLKIAEGVQGVLDGVVNLVRNLIPNLIMAVQSIVEGVVDFIFEGLPDAVESLGEKIPQLLVRFLEKLPELASKFAIGVIRVMATMSVKFVAALARNIGPLISAIINEVPRIATELVGGIILGLKELANEIANLFGFGDIFDLGQLEDQVKDIGEQVTRAASNVFQVVELEAAQRGLDVADRIRSAINSSLINIRNLWQMFMDALRRAWQWVWDMILEPIRDLVAKAFMWVWDNVLYPIINLVRDAFMWVVDNILTPLATAVSDAFGWVVDNVLMPIAGVVSDAFQWVVDNIIKPLPKLVSDAFQWVVDNIVSPLAGVGKAAFTWVKENILDKFTGVISGAFSGVEDFLDNFKFPKIETPGWLKSFTDAVNSLTNWSFPKFSAGGIVGTGPGGDGASVGIPGVGSVGVGSGGAKINIGGSGGVSVGTSGVSVGGTKIFNKGGHVGARDNIVTDINVFRNAAKNKRVQYLQTGGQSRGTDTVPAMLTPGEFVVNREATRQNLGLLQFINSQKTGTVVPVQGNTTVSVVVNAKTDLTADQIRREVIPEMKKQLKRASQDGAFVIDRRGIRS